MRHQNTKSKEKKNWLERWIKENTDAMTTDEQSYTVV